MFYSYWHATGLFNPILAYKDFLYLWIHILCMDAWKHGKGYKPKCEHGFLGTEGDLIKLFLFFSFFLCSNHILLVSLKTNYKENRSFSLQKKKKGMTASQGPSQAYNVVERNQCLKKADLNAQLPSTLQVTLGKSPHFTLHLLFTEVL